MGMRTGFDQKELSRSPALKLFVKIEPALPNSKRNQNANSKGWLEIINSASTGVSEETSYL
jgi:hypothetical protein